MTATRVWFARPDHYYWFTALLAARGLRTATSRIVAAIIFGLGAIPVILIGSAVGPQTRLERILAIGVAACCLVMALSWLRRQWPTRLHSLLCVVAGTFCIAVAALIVVSPICGVLGATTFAVLGAYVVCFHTTRLLAFTWTVAGITLGVLFFRLAHTDIALAVTSVGVAAMVNVFVVIACRAGIQLIRPDIHHGDIEQLTGLLHRDGFYQKAATLLASRSRLDDRYLVVLAVNIDSFSLLLGIAGARGGNQARVAVSEALGETVRHDAVLAHVAEDDFLIADSFLTAEPTALVERVRGAIATTPPHLTASIGVVSTPLGPLTDYPPYDVIDTLVGIANDAMDEARRAGGNQVRYVVRPTLATGHDEDSSV
jgi:GGDEF domain-containing protein